MAVNWILPVRGLQAVLALTVLGLMGYVSSWWSTHWRQASPSEVNFLLFAPAWSILTLIPLVLIPLKFAHVNSSRVVKWGVLAFEGLTMLYWFGGFVAMAVFLSDRICFGTVCDVARASTAISALSWVTWAVTFVFGVIGAVKGAGFSFRGNNAQVNAAKVEMHQGV